MKDFFLYRREDIEIETKIYFIDDEILCVNQEENI